MKATIKSTVKYVPVVPAWAQQSILARYAAMAMSGKGGR